MKEAPGSSETSVITRATRRNIPEETILHLIFAGVPAEIRTDHFRVQVYSGTATQLCPIWIQCWLDWIDCNEDYRQNFILIYILLLSNAFINFLEKLRYLSGSAYFNIPKPD
jgi:hypothetical protein